VTVRRPVRTDASGGVQQLVSPCPLIGDVELGLAGEEGGEPVSMPSKLCCAVGCCGSRRAIRRQPGRPGRQVHRSMSSARLRRVVECRPGGRPAATGPSFPDCANRLFHLRAATARKRPTVQAVRLSRGSKAGRASGRPRLRSRYPAPSRNLLRRTRAPQRPTTEALLMIACQATQ
jgi:hypothetical protein